MNQFQNLIYLLNKLINFLYFQNFTYYYIFSKYSANLPIFYCFIIIDLFIFHLFLTIVTVIYFHLFYHILNDKNYIILYSLFILK